MASVAGSRGRALGVWLASPMTANLLTRIVFVDQAGAVFQEANLAAIPRVGDSVDLPDLKVAGVIDRITWSVPGGMSGYPSVIVRLTPHA